LPESSILFPQTLSVHSPSIHPGLSRTCPKKKRRKKIQGAMQPTSQTQDDETVLFLFIAFGILVVLLFILALLSCQTWMLWKIASVVVEERERDTGLRYKDREGEMIVEQGLLVQGQKKTQSERGRVLTIEEHEGVVIAGR
jgi:membrane protein YdbS with pleckstrin-like domain